MKKGCIICNTELIEAPLLKYENMPKAAQKLPDKAELKLDKGRKLNISQCSGCGLVQLRGKPVSYYREVIRASAFSPEMKYFRKRQFKDFILKYGLKGQKILEIGCGNGEYLSLMRSTGIKTYGIEYSKPAVNACKRSGLKVIRFFPEKEKEILIDGPFKAFYTLNFLEHLPLPGIMLKFAANNICENGVGLIEVPNFDMIQKKHLFYEFIGDHLSYFTKDTLTALLKINGFDVLDCRIVWHNYIISSEVRKRSRMDIKSFNNNRSKITKELQEFINSSGVRRIAVWGAGHQALALIALAGIKDKICYVVDSAPFKQGRYTAATHIPIVSPDFLDKEPVAAIIIMAASYSDEVAKIIRKRYKNRIKTAIVRDNGLAVCGGF